MTEPNLGEYLSRLCDRYRRYAKALSNESERGRVLVGAAILDAALHDCLSNYFVQQGIESDLRAKLLSSDRGLLGTFWARIVICRVFGVINEKLYLALEAIRKLRNHCAHSDSPVDLTGPEVRGHTQALRGFLKSLGAVNLPDLMERQKVDDQRVIELIQDMHECCANPCNKCDERIATCDPAFPRPGCVVSIAIPLITMFLLFHTSKSRYVEEIEEAQKPMASRVS
jgi:hypothetical protein